MGGGLGRLFGRARPGESSSYLELRSLGNGGAATADTTSLQRTMMHLDAQKQVLDGRIAHYQKLRAEEARKMLAYGGKPPPASVAAYRGFEKQLQSLAASRLVHINMMMAIDTVVTLREQRISMAEANAQFERVRLELPGGTFEKLADEYERSLETLREMDGEMTLLTAVASPAGSVPLDATLGAEGMLTPEEEEEIAQMAAEYAVAPSLPPAATVRPPSVPRPSPPAPSPSPSTRAPPSAKPRGLTSLFE